MTNPIEIATTDGLVVTRLRAALDAGPTPGPWSWWTSCSFRRLSSDATGGDGDVLHGVVQRHDNHPDVQATQATMDFIAAANPAAISTVLDLLAASRAEVERLRAALQIISKDVVSKQMLYSAMNGVPDERLTRQLDMIDRALSNETTKG